MRHLLVDYARQLRASKRGGGLAQVPIEDDTVAADDDGLAVLALDDAMRQVVAFDPRLDESSSDGSSRGSRCPRPRERSA
jgi:hypothetical protein